MQFFEHNALRTKRFFFSSFFIEISVLSIFSKLFNVSGISNLLVGVSDSF